MEPVTIGQLRLVVLTIRLDERLDVPPRVSNRLLDAVHHGEVAAIGGGEGLGSGDDWSSHLEK